MIMMNSRKINIRQEKWMYSVDKYLLRELLQIYANDNYNLSKKTKENPYLN